MPIFDDAELRRQYDNDPYSLTVQELEILKSADKLNEMIMAILSREVFDNPLFNSIRKENGTKTWLDSQEIKTFWILDARVSSMGMAFAHRYQA